MWYLPGDGIVDWLQAGRQHQAVQGLVLTLCHGDTWIKYSRQGGTAAVRRSAGPQRGGAAGKPHTQAAADQKRVRCLGTLSELHTLEAVCPAELSCGCCMEFYSKLMGLGAGALPAADLLAEPL